MALAAIIEVCPKLDPQAAMNPFSFPDSGTPKLV
jgi:hypothetical protein